MKTVDVCEGILAGKVNAFIGLGGNFVRAIPDNARLEPAWQHLKPHGADRDETQSQSSDQR